MEYEHDIFVSYNGQDAEVAQALVDRLRQRNVRPFIDRDLPPGAPWPEKLRAALRQSRCVTIFLGPHGLVRGQVEEIIHLLAKSDDRSIIPVILPGADSENLPDSLINRIWVDFRNGVDDPQALEILVKGIFGAAPPRSPAHSAAPPSSSASPPSDRPLFDRLSGRARRAILRADRFRSSKRNARIHMEHLVVGLIDEGDEPIRQVFERARIDRPGLIAILRKVRVNLPSVDQPYEPTDAASMPQLSGHVDQALNEAFRLADAAGSPETGTFHLFQGIFSVKDCAVVSALAAGGVQPELLTAGEEAGRPLTEISIRVASTGDQPVEQDTLGFEPYVEAVAEFLVNEETRPPLTLSVEGEWGSGKSSFMLQLEKALHRRCEPFTRWAFSLPGGLAKGWRSHREGRWTRLRRQLVPPCCLTVRFNAWRHDKEDALWAAFASEFLRRISRERSLLRRWLGHLRLFRGRYRWRDGWLEMMRATAVWIVLLFLGLAVPVAAFRSWPAWSGRIEKQLQDLGKESAKDSERQPAAGGAAGKLEDPKKGKKGDSLLPFYTWLVGFGGLGAYAAGVISLALKVKGVIGNPLEVNLRKYLNSPDYDGHVAFVESFHEDFRRIVYAYAGDRKVYVFIDDLDRCEVPKAADLMQALNLLIADDPRLIFIIGMDREKVAAGLAVKYEKLLPYLMPGSVDENGKVDPRAGLEYGYTFIEKFIQLPFRVPSPKPANLRDFLAALSGRIPESPASLADADSGGAGVAGPANATPPAGEALTPTDSSPTPTSDPVIAGTAGEQRQDRRERFKLILRDDSDTVREAALMAAPALGNNPRRLKQFVNLFRLRTYIACETGAFDDVDGRSLSLQQLAKFVALGLAWPGLLTDLVDHSDLLALLHRVAVGRMEAGWKPGPRESRWVRQPALMELLRHGCENYELPLPPDRYNLAHADLDRLLRVSPKVIRAQLPAPKLPGTWAPIFVDGGSGGDPWG